MGSEDKNLSSERFVIPEPFNLGVQWDFLYYPVCFVIRAAYNICQAVSICLVFTSRAVDVQLNSAVGLSDSYAVRNERTAAAALNV